MPADPEAYRDRKEQRRRRLRRDEKALDSELREKHLAAAKLARRLGRMKDPRHAADALGLRCSDEELGELVALAERDFKGLIEGDAAAVAELLNDVVVDLVCSVASRHNEVAPALLGNTVRALAQVRESYVGQGGSNDWTDVTVVFMPPDDGDPPVAA